jgi:hypothetical protein
VVAGAFVVADSVVLWASAEAGKSMSPPTNKTALQRKIALIRSRLRDPPHPLRRAQANARRSDLIQAHAG